MMPVLKRFRKGKERVKSHLNREHQNVDEGQANHTSTTAEVNAFMLLSLPVHLIFDILAKLPVYAIFNCNRMCKTFKNILSDPYFPQLHLANASRDNYNLVIQEVGIPSKIFLTPLLYLDNLALYSKSNDHCNGVYCSWQTLTPPSFIPKTKKSISAAYLIGSCNGLLCLRYYVNKPKVILFCVCNPILGEFTILPRFREFTLENAGFGFCSKTKQYKVLRFIPQFGYCDILTLGTNEWRRISDSPPQPANVIDFDSSYKGNLHWITGRCWSERLICSFNLEIERYSYKSLPCFNNTDLHSRLSYLEVGTLDGLFCVSSIVAPGRFEVYVMEDYEVNESWSKRISIDTGYDFGVYGDNVQIIRFLDNGVLLFRDPTHLVYYDTRRGTKLRILHNGGYCAKVHFPSLISLKDIVGRENVEAVERKMLHLGVKN